MYPVHVINLSFAVSTSLFKAAKVIDSLQNCLLYNSFLPMKDSQILYYIIQTTIYNEHVIHVW